MITFRELKRGDKVVIKNRVKAMPCDVTLDGRRFLTEAVETDEECTVRAFPHYDNGLGGRFVEFYLYDANGEPIKETMLVDDLDRTETSRFKIVQ